MSAMVVTCLVCRADLAHAPAEHRCRCAVGDEPIVVPRGALSLCPRHEHIPLASVDSVRVAMGKARLFPRPTIADWVQRVHGIGRFPA